MAFDSRLTRIDENRISITNPYGIDATLFANEDVPVDSPSAGIAKLIAEFEPLMTIKG